MNGQNLKVLLKNYEESKINAQKAKMNTKIVVIKSMWNRKTIKEAGAKSERERMIKMAKQQFADYKKSLKQYSVGRRLKSFEENVLPKLKSVVTGLKTRRSKQSLAVSRARAVSHFVDFINKDKK